MKTAVVIAEYQPFHNGHAVQLAALRERGFDAVAVVMSGNFVQRGTPALLPKEVRAAAALACGADLVLELPCRCAASTAENFAAAGVTLASALGCADTLAFGAETPDEPLLRRTAETLLSNELVPLLRRELEKGLPFFMARARATEALLPGSGALLRTPNNILAVEYEKALLRSGSPLRALPLARLGPAHDAPEAAGRYASASRLRALPVSEWGPYVPPEALEIYCAARRDGSWLDFARFETAALARLRERPREFWAGVPDAAEGLDGVLYEACRRAVSLEEVYAFAKSKRYSHARLRRMTLAAVLGWNGAPPAPPYLRVLGANETGRRLLGEAQGRAALPLSHSLAQLERLGGACGAAARCEAQAGDFYALCLSSPQPCGEDYRLRFLTGV